MTSSGWRIATAGSERTATVFVGLGTNLGNLRENMERGVRLLRDISESIDVSPVYASDPVGPQDQPRFWNLVVRLHTTLEPHAFLEAIQHIERELGREPTYRWGPRRMDIDILLWNDASISEPELEIPHPQMMNRAFVLKPILDLEPGLVHPATGENLSDRLAGGNFERARRILDGAELLTGPHT
jgi:2-amino-4-hydroxy-6-hydroxymethyldihydropteridine diphosphokinase